MNIAGTMLRDLEELLLRVRDPLSRGYMREATQCYGAGAYRAAVTLAVAACMYDLRRKLEDLASSGAGGSITTAHGIVESLWKNQQAYEGTLLDQAKSVDLLSPDEHKKLLALLMVRHLCAHPSGHAASPEEARSAIADSIDIVLSRPAQLGGAQIAHLVGRLASANFFPTGAGASGQRVQIVAQELARFQPRALKGAASRIAQIIEKEPPGQVHNNALAFLGLMADAEDVAGDRPAWRAIETLLVSTAPADSLLVLLRLAPRALGQSDLDVARLRARTLVRREFSAKKGARVVAKAWREAKALTDGEVADFVTVLTGACLKFGVAHATTLQTASTAASELAWPEFTSGYLVWLVAACDDADFHIANAALRWLIRADAWEAPLLTGTLGAKAVLAFARATKYGAYAGAEVRKSGIVALHGYDRALIAELAAGWTPPWCSDLWEHLEPFVHANLGDADTAKLAQSMIERIADESERLSFARSVATSTVALVEAVGTTAVAALKASPPSPTV